MTAKSPKKSPSKVPSAKETRREMKFSNYLFDELLPRYKADAEKSVPVKIVTEADLGRAVAWLIPLLEANPRLGMMFLADTEAFCRDFGFELGPTIQKHLHENVIFYKQRDPKLYQALRNGEKVDTGITGLRFRLSPELQKLAPAASLKDLQQAVKDKNLALDPILAAHFFAPPAAARKKRGGITISAPGSVTKALSTGGWNVVVQIEESFYQEMYTLYFEAMNALYFFMLIGELFGGQPAESVDPDPNHEMLTWFLRWIRVRFTINSPPVPLFVLDAGAPSNPNLSGTMRFDFNITGTIEAGDTPDNFDISTPFTAVINHRGIIGGRANGQPLHTAMENYYGAAMNGETSVTLDSGPDTIKEMFIIGAVYDYFAKELPEILILPSPHTPPFITFDQSAMYVVEESAANREAITLLFGPPGGPAEVFTEMLLPAGRNVTLGLHRGAATQMMEQNLPDLPITEDETHIQSLDINLRDGYIEITGNGFVETCWCYPWIDFDFTARVTLAIDDEGNLTATVDQTNVSSMWVTVHAILAGILLGPKGVIIGAIGWALFNFVAGGIVAGTVQDQLNVNQNFNEQFTFQLGVGSIEADFRDVQITSNGIFIHGNMSAGF